MNEKIIWVVHWVAEDETTKLLRSVVEVYPSYNKAMKRIYELVFIEPTDYKEMRGLPEQFASGIGLSTFQI